MLRELLSIPSPDSTSVEAVLDGRGRIFDFQFLHRIPHHGERRRDRRDGPLSIPSPDSTANVGATAKALGMSIFQFLHRIPQY